MSNTIAIRQRPIFGKKRKPARTWALPMLLSIPLLAAALYFGNIAPATPAVAGPPPLGCDLSQHHAAGHGPADTAREACHS
jgi:hypothetical protein